MRTKPRKLLSLILSLAMLVTLSAGITLPVYAATTSIAVPGDWPASNTIMLSAGDTLTINPAAGSPAADTSVTVTGNATIDGGGGTYHNLHVTVNAGATLTINNFNLNESGSANAINLYAAGASLTATGNCGITGQSTDTVLMGPSSTITVNGSSVLAINNPFTSAVRAGGTETFDILGTLQIISAVGATGIQQNAPLPNMIINKNGSGTMTVSSGATGVYCGTLNVNAGVLSVNSTNGNAVDIGTAGTPGTINIAASGELEAKSSGYNAIQGEDALTILNNGGLYAEGTTAISTVGALSLQMSQTATTQLTNHNSASETHNFTMAAGAPAGSIWSLSNNAVKTNAADSLNASTLSISVPAGTRGTVTLIEPDYTINGTGYLWPASGLINLVNNDVMTVVSANSPTVATMISIDAGANVTINGRNSTINNLYLEDTSPDTAHTININTLNITAPAGHSAYWHQAGVINLTGNSNFIGSSDITCIGGAGRTLAITSSTGGMLSVNGNAIGDRTIDASGFNVQGNANVYVYTPASGPAIYSPAAMAINVDSGASLNVQATDSASGVMSLGNLTITNNGTLYIGGAGAAAIDCGGAVSITMSPGASTTLTNNSAAAETYPFTMASGTPAGTVWQLSPVSIPATVSFAAGSTASSSPANISVAPGGTGTIKLVPAVAPTLSNATVSGITQTGAGCYVDTVGATTLYYVLYLTSASAPSIADIKAGTGAVTGHASSFSTSDGTQSIGMLGLTANTQYTIYYVGTNASGDSAIASASFTTLAAGTPVCSIGATTYTTLDAALAAVTNGQTIKLLQNITQTWTSTITINGIAVAFDTNGFNLNVTSTGGAGLVVSNNGVVNTIGTGQFNVNSTTSYGIYAQSGGKVTVTSAGTTSATGGYAVYATAAGSAATITGDVTATVNAGGVQALNGAAVTVGGNVTETGGHFGVYANGGGSVTVAGNIYASGGAGEGAVCLGLGSAAVVGGNITAGIGTEVQTGATVIVNGTVTAPVYTIIEHVAKTAADITTPTTMAGYLTYTDGTSTVWVKDTSAGLSVNVPADVTQNGVTAHVTVSGATHANGSLAAGEAVTVHVALTGTAAAQGVLTLGFHSASAGTITASGGNTNPSNFGSYVGTFSTSKDYTFTMPSASVTDLTMTFTFAAAAVTGVSASPATIASAGGASTITVSGSNILGVKVTAYDGATPTTITGGNNTPTTVSLTFPANASTTADKVYTIKVSLDGGTTWETQTATVTVSKASAADTTPPTVVSVTPSGTGQPISGNVVITFSEAMNTTPGTVQLNSLAALSGGTWSAGNTVYTIPYSALAYSTAYTVNISGFKDVAGNTMTADGSHSFTTAAAPLTAISLAAIAGVTPPVAGAVPVTAITETAQYTGTVTWSGSPATFGNGTVYTATITLTPKTGYTLTGVAANFFTVAGTTTVTNPANSGVITAVFPAAAAIQTYALSIQAGTGGTVTGTPGNYAANSVISVSATVYSNYKFNGWTTSNGGVFGSASSPSTTFTMPAGDTTITANFSTVSSGSSGSSGGGTVYRLVTFKTNGGSTVNSQSVANGSKLTKPADPVKDGYTFAGWYSDSGLTKAFDFTKGITSDTTIYAKWSQNTTAKPNPDPAPGTANQPTPATTQPSGPSAQWQNPFSDVQSTDWFYGDVQYALTNNLFKGVSATSFAPNGPMTRAMFVTVLWRATGSPSANGASPFKDVQAGAYYAQAVNWAASHKVVLGISNTLFAPDRQVTREQMAAILYRYEQFNGSTPPTVAAKQFADASKISDYAKDAVNVLVGQGVLTGLPNNLFDPKGTATRVQVAAIMHRFLAAL